MNCRIVVSSSLAGALLVPSTQASAHEAWLLTPKQMIELAKQPLPELFTSLWPATGFIAAFVCFVSIMVVLEERWLAFEHRTFRPVVSRAEDWGPLVIRLGLAIMLFTAATGLLPLHGTAVGTKPTLFVPDMQLKLIDPFWRYLVQAQIIVAALLAFGFATRLAALCVIAMSVIGFATFGEPFANYGFHFIAPAVFILGAGAGRFSMMHLLAPDMTTFTRNWPSVPTLTYRVVLLMVGGTFAYLGITCKMMQPTLLIAILKHGDFPMLGLSYEVVALIMGLVEITAGLLLAAGLLVRPIALLLIGAFTFFALVLGETPFLHANLYALAVLFLMIGRSIPGPTTILMDRAPRGALASPTAS